MSTPPRLTTTSYVVLGLLCTRPWSAYELTRQMERGWADVWPRAVRGLYEEPKKLVAHGYASTERERHGARGRAVYRATAEGQRSFCRWLEEPPAPPTFGSEALVRVVFADRGSLADLRVAIRSVREHAVARSAALLAQGSQYGEPDGPFPERVHLLHLAGDYLAEQFGAMIRWADRAEAEVATWTRTDALPAADRLTALAGQVETRFRDNLHRGDRPPGGAPGDHAPATPRGSKP